MICPICGRQIQDNAKFCGKCGKQVPRCPSCGKVLYKRIRFCSQDGTSVIGTCLAKELTKAGGRSLSEGSNIYIVKGELNSRGELIFRDNARFMLEGKHVLILTCSLTTGTTALRGRQSVEYYGGRVVGVASVYAAFHELDGLPVVSLFDTNTIPDYVSYAPSECPMCKRGEPIDAVVNTFGYSKVK